ncbi:hypothetical protein HRI_004726300 [Hibiscus trionum]|uniref:Endonuclease/exonuclease/phosphatase domain-containing protein n=1 Tax=Hibiscus trionum TaxID=183268 RepID=A0A9W7MV63_HIBTR|nr:hypothetical protein HRI_004726300 [Hibiscus trionum]
MVNLSIIAWNIRGLGKKEKSRAVRNLVATKKPGIVFLQETKLPKISFAIQRRLSGNLLQGFCFAPTEGSVGGLLSMWDENWFEVTSRTVNRRFIALLGKIKEIQLECAFINVYGPAADAEKRDFFEELLSYCEGLDTPFCIGGDFCKLYKIRIL